MKITCNSDQAAAGVLKLVDPNIALLLGHPEEVQLRHYVNSWAKSAVKGYRLVKIIAEREKSLSKDTTAAAKRRVKFMGFSNVATQLSDAEAEEDCGEREPYSEDEEDCAVASDSSGYVASRPIPNVPADVASTSGVRQSPRKRAKISPPYQDSPPEAAPSAEGWKALRIPVYQVRRPTGHVETKLPFSPPCAPKIPRALPSAPPLEHGTLLNEYARKQTPLTTPIPENPLQFVADDVRDQFPITPLFKGSIDWRLIAVDSVLSLLRRRQLNDVHAGLYHTNALITAERLLLWVRPCLLNTEGPTFSEEFGGGELLHFWTRNDDMWAELLYKKNLELSYVIHI
ncbi:hypothetical protein TELCIR_22907, partial [Teladorsagia circumcincta]